MKTIVMAALVAGAAGCRPTPTLAEQGATPVSETGQIEQDGAEPVAPQNKGGDFFTGRMWKEGDVTVLESKAPLSCTGLRGGDDDTTTCFHIERDCGTFRKLMSERMGVENVTACEQKPNGACFKSSSTTDGNPRLNCAPTMGGCIHAWSEERASSDRNDISTCFVVRVKQ